MTSVIPQNPDVDAFCSRCREHKRLEVRLDSPTDVDSTDEVYLFCWDCLTDGVVQIDRWNTNGWDVHWLNPWRQKKLI